MRLAGFDASRWLLVDPMGGLELVSVPGEVAARWSFPKLSNHWRTKHAKCVYVPSIRRIDTSTEYRFGHRLGLGEGTGFELLASALSRGGVFDDPGLKLEHASTSHPSQKRRNQIRVGFSNVADLYDVYEVVDLRGRDER